MKKSLCVAACPRVGAGAVSSGDEPALAGGAEAGGTPDSLAPV